MIADDELKFVRRLFTSRKPFNWRSWGIILVDEIRDLKKVIKNIEKVLDKTSK